MRCVAIPYLAEQADDPAFATADLLVRGGQDAFDPRRVHDWLTGVQDGASGMRTMGPTG